VLNESAYRKFLFDKFLLHSSSKPLVQKFGYPRLANMVVKKLKEQLDERSINDSDLSIVNFTDQYMTQLLKEHSPNT